MLSLGNNAWLVEHESELPDLVGANLVFLDGETTSFNDKDEAFHPYRGDRACGWAITVDDDPRCYYVPIRHRSPGAANLDPAVVTRWLATILDECEAWVNHNVKFDAHFLAVEGYIFKCRIVDTMMLSKMLDSDRFGHTLKGLARDWLGEDTMEEKRIHRMLLSMKTKDFARIPSDILGEYACADVRMNRRLWHHVMERMPDEMLPLCETEILLTAVLFDMEHEGLMVDQTATLIEARTCLKRILESAEEIEARMSVLLTNSNRCMEDIIVHKLGLPILAWNVKNGRRTGPSFDKDAMKLYAKHPRVVGHSETQEIIDLLLTNRNESHFKGLFVEPFVSKIDASGLLHSSYNQIVRTGRMSCSDPNAQQMSPRARALIRPKDGEAFLSGDASQLEFRIICHYIRDQDAIRAFAADPDTDFHQWVADMCETGRSPAKTMNFLMAFGGGKRRATEQLMGDETIIEAVTEQITTEIETGRLEADRRLDRMEQLCVQRAARIYDVYHSTLPGIKVVSRTAAHLCSTRGYIRNVYKRRRHLPQKASHKAFNSMIQGCAMDYIKERMVALAPRYCSWVRDLGLKMNANVHDEILFSGPRDVVFDRGVQTRVKEALEESHYPYKVPMRWGMGASDVNWALAKGD